MTARALALCLLPFLFPQDDPAAAVLKALQAGRPDAERRLAQARDAAAADLREERDREKRLERAMIEMSKRTPLRLRVSETLTLDEVRVAAYAQGVLKLTWPQGEVEYPLEQLPAETRSALLLGALADATARDHFEIGKLLLHLDDYERAGRCFANARRKDPALAPLCPDVEAIRNAARFFRGSFKATGSNLGLRWAFSAADEMEDFAAVKGEASVVPGQGLVAGGPRLALTVVRDIPFRDRVKVSALARESGDTAHLLGLRFVKPDGSEVFVYGALATSLKTFLVSKLEDDTESELLAPTAGATGNRMTLDFHDGRLSFKVGDKTVWTGQEGGFTDVSVVLGGVALTFQGKPPGRASATFRDVSLFGGVNPLWMAKKSAGFRDAVTAELAKEHLAGPGAAAAEPARLSVDVLAAGLPEPASTAWTAAQAKLRDALRKRTRDEVAAAEQAMTAVTTGDASFAPAWYWRGSLQGMLGNRRAAAEHYEAALGKCLSFPEALCARATLHALEGDWTKTKELVELALALKPDLGEAQLLRARLLREAGKPEEALQAARVARRLSPLDPDVQARAAMLANVVRGPAWPRPQRVETAHYLLRSDLPPAKLRPYGDHLEALRPVYEEVLGRAVPPGKRADVLLFNSSEGYYAYMDFTAGDRQEHTLGAFSSWHGQMALFEGDEPAETLRVLTHEGFHQVLHAVAPDVPIWFNEGMAEYVGATKVEKGKVVEKGGLQEGRLANLKAAVRYGWKPIPFASLMQESQAEFYGQWAPLKYAQAWSMIHYFQHGEGGARKAVLRAYIDRLLAGDSGRVAFDATFAKENLPALEAAWAKHHALPEPGPSRPPPPPLPATPAGPIDVLRLLQTSGKPLPGGWAFRGDGLEATPKPAEIPAPLPLPVQVKGDFTLTLVVQRSASAVEEPLNVGLAWDGVPFVLSLDRSGISQLEVVDGAPFRANETTVRRPPLMLSGRAHTLTCTVGRDGLVVKLDGENLIAWKGPARRLSLPPAYATSTPRTLFLDGGRSAYSISKLSLHAEAADVAAPSLPRARPSLPLDALKAKLASAVEADRIDALQKLGQVNEKEARSLVASKLTTDGSAVRLAAARAIAFQRHPSSAEAVGKALQSQGKDAALASALIQSLGELGTCASIPHLIKALELNQGKHLTETAAALLAIGCPEACPGLASLHKRADEQIRRAVVDRTPLSPAQSNALNQIRERTESLLNALTRGRERRPGETWSAFVARGAHKPKPGALHHCGATGLTFESATEKPGKCPHAEPGPDHEDAFLRHLTD